MELQQPDPLLEPGARSIGALLDLAWQSVKRRQGEAEALALINDVEAGRQSLYAQVRIFATTTWIVVLAMRGEASREVVSLEITSPRADWLSLPAGHV